MAYVFPTATPVFEIPIKFQILPLQNVFSGTDRIPVVQIFSKEVFCLLLPCMCSLLDAVYETFTFFQITLSDDVIS